MERPSNVLNVVAAAQGKMAVQLAMIVGVVLVTKLLGGTSVRA